MGSPSDTDTTGNKETVSIYKGNNNSAMFEMWLNAAKGISYYIYTNPNDTAVIRDSANSVNDGTWHYMVGVYDGSGGTLHVYQDGALSDGTLTGSVPATMHSSSEPVVMGAYNGNTTAGQFTPAGFFPGSLDEIRISNTARSSDWILAEYRNQSTPGSFYSIGVEQ